MKKVNKLLKSILNDMGRKKKHLILAETYVDRSNFDMDTIVNIVFFDKYNDMAVCECRLKSEEYTYADGLRLCLAIDKCADKGINRAEAKEDN